MAFVGYVVLWNVSLQLNSVGFYQLMKVRASWSAASVLAWVQELQLRLPWGRGQKDIAPRIFLLAAAKDMHSAFSCWQQLCQVLWHC